MAREFSRTIRALTDGVWSELLGPTWQTVSIRSLDLSSDKYYVESLSAGGGLRNPALRLSNLTTLNAGNNSLTEIDGVFDSEAPFAATLQSLNLSRNRLLNCAMLELPNLRTLDLSHNRLATVPNLAVCEKLENLDLSFNLIEEGWEQLGRLSNSLKLLNLGHNRLYTNPTQLLWGFKELHRLSKLASITFDGNPFTKWFPEYTAFAVRAMPTLTEIDGFAVTDVVEEQAQKVELHDIEVYESIFQKRMSLFQDCQIATAKVHATKELDTVTLPIMTNVLLRSLEQVESAARLIGFVVEAAEFLLTGTSADTRRLFKETGAGKEAAAISDFIQAAALVIQRDVKHEALMVRGLTLLATVPDFGLGAECFRQLRFQALSGVGRDEVVAEAIRRCCLDLVRNTGYEDARVQTILRGIASMPRQKALARACAGITIVVCDIVEGHNHDAAAAAVLALICDHKQSAVEVAGEAVPQVVVRVVQQELQSNDIAEVSELALAMLHVGSQCATYVPKVATLFARQGLHTGRLFDAVKEAFREPNTADWRAEKARGVAAILDFLTAMLRINKTAYEDLVHKRHLADLLLIPLKEDERDPLLFASACSGVLAIMERELSATSHEENAPITQYISDECRRFVDLFAMAGGRDYPRVCELALKHTSAGTVDLRGFQAPSLASNDNPVVHQVMRGLASILRFFFGATHPTAAAVGNFLSERFLHRAIFQLLPTPALSVKVQAAAALSFVDIALFSAEDVQVILDLLRQFTSFADEDAGELIVKVIRVLRRFVDDQGGSGSHMAQPAETFEAVYTLLFRAVSVIARTASSDGDKSKICLACVDFLRSCTRYPELRADMRSRKLEELFCDILETEQRTCASDFPDVAVERCWTGRSISSLLRILPRLRANGKVAFRVLSQMADVICGRSHMEDSGTEIQITDLCERETQFLKAKNLRREMYRLDANEWEDRGEQHEAMLRLRAVESVVSFLARLASPSWHEHRIQERKCRATAEHWAGRLKGRRNLMEQAIARGEAVELEIEGDPGAMEFYEAPEGCEDEFRWVQMQAMHRASDIRDLSIAAEYMASYDGFYGGGGFWSNPARSELRISYVLAAVCRLLYALLAVPVKSTVFAYTCEYLRQADNVRKLISLLEVVPLFDCHAGAKFLAVVTRAIVIEEFEPAESMDMIVIYDILMDLAKRLAAPFLQILRSCRSRPLSPTEQTFATELVKLIATIVKQIHLVKFSEVSSRLQRWGVEESLTRYITPVIIRLLTALIVYDLQIAMGSTSASYVAHLLESTAGEREQMRELSLLSLARIVQFCRVYEYAVIEALNVAEVFQKVPLRASLMFHLLETTNLGHYRQGVQIRLSKKSQRAERVLFVAIAHHWSTFPLKVAQPLLFVVTNCGWYYLEKPHGIWNPQADAAHTPEENAKIMKILDQRSYNAVECVVRSFPTKQTLLIVWRGASGETHHDALTFIQPNLTNDISKAFLALSGRNLSGSALIFKDYTIWSCLKQWVARRAILTAAFVYAAADEGKPELLLHLLSRTKIYEFSVAWDNWICPPTILMGSGNAAALGEVLESDDDEEDEDEMNFEDDTDEIKNRGLQNFAAIQEKAVGDASLLDALPEFVSGDEKRRAQARREYVAKLKEARTNFLILRRKYKLKYLAKIIFGQTHVPTTEYCFQPYTPEDQKAAEDAENEEGADDGEDEEEELDEDEEEEEVVKLDSLRVTYLHDSTRERWRSMVAFALNRMPSALHWRRRWTAQEKKGDE